MYERFTDRARKVIQLANQEAHRLNHEYLGTEHLLLGLIKEGSGVAANVLKHLQVDLAAVRREKLVMPGPGRVTRGRLPPTPVLKKVLDYAIEEARNVNHNHGGTEHLLLGLLRDEGSMAGHVLNRLGLNVEKVRAEILIWLNHAGCQPAGGAPCLVRYHFISTIRHRARTTSFPDIAAPSRLGVSAVSSSNAPSS